MISKSDRASRYRRGCFVPFNLNGVGFQLGVGIGKDAVPVFGQLNVIRKTGVNQVYEWREGIHGQDIGHMILICIGQSVHYARLG